MTCPECKGEKRVLLLNEYVDCRTCGGGSDSVPGGDGTLPVLWNHNPSVTITLKRQDFENCVLCKGRARVEGWLICRECLENHQSVERMISGIRQDYSRAVIDYLDREIMREGKD